MTTVFDVQFNDPAEWLAELHADVKRDRIPDRIVRLVVRKRAASRSDLSNGIERDSRPMAGWKSHVVEATYVSASAQLVKLSAWCGYVYSEEGGLAQDRPREGRDPSIATLTAEGDILRRLSTALNGIENIEIRGGALIVEDGAWSATPFETVEAPSTAVVCATCGKAIYSANNAWRHEETRQAEIYDVSPCPDCVGGRTVHGRLCSRCRITPGTRRVLHHLADPQIVGRKV